MENLVREQTEESPEIQFVTTGQLLIRGISVLENVNGFYTDVFNWLNEFGKRLPESVSLVFEIEYLNTSSNKICVELARKVSGFKNACKNLSIVWRYENGDDDAYELGKDIEYWTGSEFKFETYN